MSTLEVKNLHKKFGSVFAVDGVNFTVEKGEIFGFLGPNGAGKTTTIRCIMDFIRPTEGEIKILGMDAQKDSAAIKKRVGYLPGNVKLYENWTGKDHIDFIEKIKGKSENVDSIIEKLQFNTKVRAKNLSSGNKQKLGLIMALMNNPELIVMDEPTVGLDPLLQNTIYEILEDLRKKGTTIFMSSHNLPEVERLCSRVGIIKAGKMIALEDIENLHKKKMHQVTVNFGGSFNKNDFNFEGVEIKDTLPDGLILNAKGDIDVLIKKLAQYNVKDISISHATLEEVFLEFYMQENVQVKE